MHYIEYKIECKTLKWPNANWIPYPVGLKGHFSSEAAVRAFVEHSPNLNKPQREVRIVKVTTEVLP